MEKLLPTCLAAGGGGGGGLTDGGGGVEPLGREGEARSTWIRETIAPLLTAAFTSSMLAGRHVASERENKVFFTSWNLLVSSAADVLGVAPLRTSISRCFEAKNGFNPHRRKGFTEVMELMDVAPPPLQPALRQPLIDLWSFFSLSGCEFCQVSVSLTSIMLLTFSPASFSLIITILISQPEINDQDGGDNLGAWCQIRSFPPSDHHHLVDPCGHEPIQRYFTLHPRGRMKLLSTIFASNVPVTLRKTTTESIGLPVFDFCDCTYATLFQTYLATAGVIVSSLFSHVVHVDLLEFKTVVCFRKHPPLSRTSGDYVP